MPIFDQGYQHWKGPLVGHAWRWLAIARHGARVQGRNRILRFLLLISWLPALALVIAIAMWGLLEQKSETLMGFAKNFLPPDILGDPRSFRSAIWTVAFSFFFQFQMFFIMLLVVVAGPGLISRDLRFNALPLYFARPLTRFDYFLGKLGVIGAVVASVAVGPALFAYVIGVCFCLDLSVVKDTYQILLGSVAYGLIITLSVGTLMLAMSSLTRRSVYVGITWAGLWLISTMVGGILSGFHRESSRMAAREGELSTWQAENPAPPGIQMRGSHPELKFQPGKQQRMKPVVADPEQQQAADEWWERREIASQQAWYKAQERLGEVARRDWRPLCSYVANLERIEHWLLNTDAAWVTIGKAVERPRAMFAGHFGPGGGSMPMPVNDRRLADQIVPQYPWYWSAGVLVALLGLSTWILAMRVKSLDRLK